MDRVFSGFLNDSATTTRPSQSSRHEPFSIKARKYSKLKEEEAWC